ncbi:exported hypothetical protein [Bradyrhizobium sp. STM 3809]|nr:exported hypothetical protein [Bradyrhizobium sp. STM 3809]
MRKTVSSTALSAVGVAAAASGALCAPPSELVSVPHAMASATIRILPVLTSASALAPLEMLWRIISGKTCGLSSLRGEWQRHVRETGSCEPGDLRSRVVASAPQG